LQAFVMAACAAEPIPEPAIPLNRATPTSQRSMGFRFTREQPKVDKIVILEILPSKAFFI
jgi:hypothetical protein